MSGFQPLGPCIGIAGPPTGSASARADARGQHRHALGKGELREGFQGIAQKKAGAALAKNSRQKSPWPCSNALTIISWLPDFYHTAKNYFPRRGKTSPQNGYEGRRLVLKQAISFWVGTKRVVAILAEVCQVTQLQQGETSRFFHPFCEKILCKILFSSALYLFYSTFCHIACFTAFPASGWVRREEDGKRRSSTCSGATRLLSCSRH